MYNGKNLLAWVALCLFGAGSMAQDFNDAPKPYGALPSERQLAWHETEMYCLIHFTPTTFQDKEWGYGDADPAIFNPKNFDAEQIVAAAKAGGFRGIISVAKHHDGFALWPTKTAAYNISESPWRNGKGDMVKEFQLAAEKLGMKFGVYCSPWDRNNPAYGSPAYVSIYRNQLKELYSNYGELFMSWHDGANGGDGYYGGKREQRKVDQSTYYDWMNTWAITRALQPTANIFSDIGLDVRWVGNEKGVAGETSWSTITLVGKDGKAPMPGYMDDSNLGTGTRNGESWIPTECDVPLRPGWFYHASQDDQVKTPAMLFDLYCKSVGRGGAFDLGLSPNTDGLLHETDVKVLKEFGDLLKKVFAKNLMDGARLQASNIRGENTARYGMQHLLDKDRYSYWATDDEVHQAELEIELPGKRSFNIIRLRENIKLGQRIDSILVDEWKEGQWMPLARATSIGANRIIRMPQAVETNKLRLRVFAPVSIALSDIGLFAEPEELKDAGTTERKGLEKNTWSTPTGEAKKAIDNDKESFFLTKKNSLVVNLGSVQRIAAVGYLPRQDGSSIGMVEKYAYYTSNDGKAWKLVADGEFSNIKANPILQYTPLKEKVDAQYIKLEAKQSVSDKGKIAFSIAELEVYEKK
ncbi:alpha-L-fucosidase [Olivibacter sp. XZL3]|uniref:alpha-L-fucosidase n=1 Tax=Olivibacter sp. XZL3 TaxID=1735116 RepID=UPI00106468D0|nr:alpha-L-fucosidase [Olivibacter sp. XZL3]